MTFAELGKKLRKARLAKKLRYQDMQRRTKIQVEYIKRMESGDFSFFPEAVVRGFLKSYAREVDLPLEEVLALYDEAKQGGAAAEKKAESATKRPQKKAQSTPPGAPVKSSKTSDKQPSDREKPAARETERPREEAKGVLQYKGEIILGILVALILGGIIYVYLQHGREYFSRPQKPAKKISVFEARKERLIQEQQKKPPVEPIRLPEKVRLRVMAAETTWVRLIADGRDTSEFLFAPGMQRTFEASQQLQLKAGRADGLILWVNQDSIGKLGTAAQIVSKLVITREGIVEKKLRRPRPPRPSAPAQADTLSP